MFATANENDETKIIQLVDYGVEILCANVTTVFSEKVADYSDRQTVCRMALDCILLHTDEKKARDCEGSVWDG